MTVHWPYYLVYVLNLSDPEKSKNFLEILEDGFRKKSKHFNPLTECEAVLKTPPIYKKSKSVIKIEIGGRNG